MNQYICHCTVQVFDGVSVLTSRPTEIVDAISERAAYHEVRMKLDREYRKRGCSVKSVTIPPYEKDQLSR
jgi:hypothetical protein